MSSTNTTYQMPNIIIDDYRKLFGKAYKSVFPSGYWDRMVKPRKYYYKYMAIVQFFDGFNSNVNDIKNIYLNPTYIDNYIQGLRKRSSINNIVLINNSSNPKGTLMEKAYTKKSILTRKLSRLKKEYKKEVRSIKLIENSPPRRNFQGIDRFTGQVKSELV